MITFLIICWQLQGWATPVLEGRNQARFSILWVDNLGFLFPWPSRTGVARLFTSVGLVKVDKSILFTSLILFLLKCRQKFFTICGNDSPFKVLTGIYLFSIKDQMLMAAAALEPR